jgi:hypothetical protein
MLPHDRCLCLLAHVHVRPSVRLSRARLWQVIVELRTRMETESGKYPKRKACIKWVKWVTEAGGIVRGTRPREELLSLSMEAEKAEQERLQAAKKARPDDPFAGMDVADYFDTGGGAKGGSSGGAAGSGGSILGGPVNEFDDIWPLQLIDLRDDEQFDLLYVRPVLAVGGLYTTY